jgi:hypothetical protein
MMKKMRQSIVLLLLLLVISSNLLASSYSRTAGGSWDDWGWSADWFPPFSFPIGQAITLGLSAAVIAELKAAYTLTRTSTQTRMMVKNILLNWDFLRRIWVNYHRGNGGFMTFIDHLLKSSLFGLSAGSFKFLDDVLGVSTPNFYQFLSDSSRSEVDNFQLRWSKTAGPWLYYFTWWLLGTPGNMFDDVTLFNEGTDPQNFDLKSDRTLNGLNVVGNSWTLSGGTLTFRTPTFNGMGMLRYSGPQTLTFETPLDLPQGLAIHVSEQAGVVRLLGEVNLWNALKKTGYGTLLMETPLHVNKGWGDGFFDPLNRYRKKKSSPTPRRRNDRYCARQSDG